MIKIDAIQALKSQIDKIQHQIDTVLMFQKNFPIVNPMVINNQDEQLINLGIQILDTGILALKSVFNLSMHFNKYRNKLQNISNEINIITTHPLQTMQQQLAQMRQLMIQQQAIQQQMNEQAKRKVNIIFHDTRGIDTILIVDSDITIEELYSKYMDKAPLYSQDRKDFVFRYNGQQLKKDDKRKIKDYFNFGSYIPSSLNIKVWFLNDLLSGFN